MLAGMGLAAAACMVLALVPTLTAPALTSAVGVLDPRAGAAVDGQVTLHLAGIASTMSPLLIAAALAAAVVGLLAGVRLAASRRPRREARLWDCGGGPLSARMEYTATSFAEPLQRVFDDVLRPEQDIDVTPHTESQYLVEAVQFHRRVPDRIELRLYAPVFAAVRAAGQAARVLANGSVHRYLAYGFYGFTGLLVALAVTR
jgi:hydrogenase-4 component B